MKVSYNNIIENKEKYIKHFFKQYSYLGWDTLDDAFSESLLKIWKKNLSNITEGYVYSTMKNVIIDKHRKPGLQVVYCEELCDQVQETVDNTTYRDVRPVIYEMPEVCKRYMILRFGFQMKYKEIEKFLGKCHGTVAPNIMRAKQKLKVA